jgi:cell division protein FtsQ
MSEARVRRGAGGKAKTRRASPKASVTRKIAKSFPVDQARANRLAGFVFAGFLLAIGLVVLVALDIPARAERSAGAAVGRAGFVVSGYQIVGLRHMDRAPIDEVVTDQLHRAADAAGEGKAP